MDIPDYDKALYYSLWGQWDDLFMLMVRTNDDFLSKKIHQFLNAYQFEANQEKVLQNHDELLFYIDHAMKQTPMAVMEV